MTASIEINESILEKINSQDEVILELGCGERKRHSNAIGIDALSYPGVDIVGDIYSMLKQLPDQRVSGVYSYHCFEHLDNLGEIMRQLGRIMKAHARLFVVTPHFSNPYYYSDVTHKQPFGLYTFSYFAKDNLFARRCPSYQRQIDFELQKVKLVFKSSPPFYGRFAIKKLPQTFFNMNYYLKEFYEENLCWMIPCYEIHYALVRL